MLNHGASSPVSIHRDILVLGGSSGSLEALKTIVRDLPANLPASIFIVSHISPEHESYLPDTLQRECKLPVAHATHGAAIRQGRIYVAPPDHHLIIEVRCRVGHIFSPESMLANHAEVLERALWVAVRTHEERASLTREMANVARHTSSPHVIGKFESEAAEAARNAEIIRQMLLNGDALHD